jgi:hypothetical protein
MSLEDDLDLAYLHVEQNQLVLVDIDDLELDLVTLDVPYDELNDLDLGDSPKCLTVDLFALDDQTVSCVVVHHLRLDRSLHAAIAEDLVENLRDLVRAVVVLGYVRFDCLNVHDHLSFD